MNEYIEALKLAIESNGKESKFTVSNLDGSNSHETTMIEEKQGTVGAYQVRWHNRWCFYYKGNFVAQYFLNDNHHFRGSFGMDIKPKQLDMLIPKMMEAINTLA